MISKKEDEELKPYYDYQRKVAYNKEKIYEMAHKFDGRMFDTSGAVNPSDFGQHLWDRIPPEEKSFCVPNRLFTNKLNQYSMEKL